MLGNALNRCHATPMLRTRLTTTSQASETTILTNATTLSRSGLSGSTVATRLETGCDQVGASVRAAETFRARLRREQRRGGAWVRPEETCSARMSRMHRPTVRTTASTKYPRPSFEPAKRLLRPWRRGWSFWRREIRDRIPGTVAAPVERGEGGGGG